MATTNGTTTDSSNTVTQTQETLPNKVDGFKDKAQYMDRTIDKGIVNSQTGSSIGIRQNGDITLASNSQAQYRIAHDNQMATEISMQSNTITNRKNIAADEIIINKHKLNSQIYELADFKEIQGATGTAIGNLTMFGTVLVKTWDYNLNKYVLIRRLIRTPVFSPILNVADSPESLGIDTNIANDLTTDLTSQ